MYVKTFVEGDVLIDVRSYGQLDGVKEPRRHLPPVAKNLRALRQAAGYRSQEKLAEDAGMSRGTVADIERGKDLNPKKETLEALASLLNVSIDDLLAESGEEAGPAFLERFKASPWFDDVKPTKDELAWLRALPKATWLAEEPSNRSIAALIEARRSTKM